MTNVSTGDNQTSQDRQASSATGLAESDQTVPQSSIGESDPAFLLKLLIVSFAGMPIGAVDELAGGVDCSLFVMFLKGTHSLPSYGAGSAAVKYGSLLLDTPFQPSLPLALTFICAPCVAFGIFLTVKSNESV